VGHPSRASWLCVVFVAGVVLAAGCSRPAVRLPVLGQVPPFVLTDETGASFAAADKLAGQVWVANFIFTRCPDICPTFTAMMARVQEQTPVPHLVSFSVDPTHDTPPVLAAYARQHGALPARWSFLTGQFADIRAAVEGAMKVHMEQEGQGAGGVPNISHGSHFVLVDRQLRIRGYYNMTDQDAIARIVRDSAAVAAEPTAR
jgi:protein SCO1/2